MIKSLKKSLVLSCVLALLWPSLANADMNVTRIAGTNRYETAMKVQQKYFTKASGNLVILASGTDFRTALYGSYLANALKVPYYVIPNAGMSKAMFNELKSKDIKRAYIMGDYNVLNRSIDNSLKSINITPTRFTNTTPHPLTEDFVNQIDWSIFQTYYYGEARGDIGNVVLINDNIFPDILSAVPFTSELARRHAMMMCGYDENEYTRQNDYLKGYGFIIGGFNSVPSKFITEEDFDHPVGLVRHEWTDDDGTKQEYYTGRIAGQDRYKTAIEIAKAYKIVLQKNISTAVIVDGTNYPDALASGTAATMNNGTILLTKPGQLNKDTKTFIRENNIKNIIIVGGERSVSKNVENELRGL